MKKWRREKFQKAWYMFANGVVSGKDWGFLSRVGNPTKTSRKKIRLTDFIWLKTPTMVGKMETKMVDTMLFMLMVFILSKNIIWFLLLEARPGA